MQYHGTFGKTFVSCSVSTDDTCQAEMGEKRNFSAFWRLSGRFGLEDQVLHRE